MTSPYSIPTKTIFLFTILSIAACTTGPPIESTPSIGTGLTTTQKLQNAIDNQREKSDVKGVSAAVIMPDEQTWVGVSGMSDPTTKESIQSEMYFELCSIGKNYMAALVLQLVEEGRLVLKDPLSIWLPDFPNIDNGATIRQLLNHTSGIYDYVKHPDSPFQMIYKSTKTWTQEQILLELVEQPYFSPGNGWHYSTTNYILLRLIAEKATGSKVSLEIERRFLDPLGLTDTIILEPFEPIPKEINVANNWIGEFVDLAPKPQPWTATVPYLLYATAEDAARWAHLLFDKKKVLSQNSLDQMHTFHSPTPNEPPYSGYGLGVIYIDSELANDSFGVEGVRMWGHGGSTHGFRAIVMYLPDHRSTISVMINESDDKGVVDIFSSLLKVVVDEIKKPQ